MITAAIRIALILFALEIIRRVWAWGLRCDVASDIEEAFRYGNPGPCVRAILATRGHRLTPQQRQEIEALLAEREL